MAARQLINHPVSHRCGRALTVVYVAVLISILPYLTLLGNVLAFTYAGAMLFMAQYQKPGQTVRERMRLDAPGGL